MYCYVPAYAEADDLKLFLSAEAEIQEFSCKGSRKAKRRGQNSL